MIALVKYAAGPGNVELREVETPVPAANQVRLEVCACGICGTDLHVYHDRFRNFPPVILGHEFSGTLVETGSEVREFQVGDRVTVLGAIAVTCGHCEYCRSGEIMFCPDRRGMGHGVNGAFTRTVVAREDQLFRLPEALPLEQGALVEPFAVAVHAVAEMSEVHAGDVALISGPGPIGLMCLKLLRSRGVKTLVAGMAADRERLAYAKQQGADRAVAVDEASLPDVIHQETGGRGVDLAFECAGSAASVTACLQSVRPLGSLTQVGHFGHEITLPYDAVAFKQLRIVGSVGYTVASWRRALRILDEGRVTLGDLISHQLPLARWEEAFELCEKKKALKVLLKP